MGGCYARLGVGVYGMSLYLLLNIAVNLKLLQTVKSIKKSFRGLICHNRKYPLAAKETKKGRMEEHKLRINGTLKHKSGSAMPKSVPRG